MEITNQQMAPAQKIPQDSVTNSTVSNQKGFIPLILGVIILLIIVAGGAYYLWSKNTNLTSKPQVQQPATYSITPTSNPITSQKPPIAQSSITNELNGFPVYPSAIFTKKQIQPPCVEGLYSGFSNCGSTTYFWDSKDDYDQISSWYREDKSGYGWKCSGGAGSYDGPRSSSSTTSCKKDSLNYGLFLSADASKTEITLQIPYKNNIQNPTAPENVTQNFYNWYLSCLNNHFQDSIDQTPNTTCPYENSAYISPELLQNIKNNIGGDPILCAQNTPLEIKADKAKIAGNKSNLIVHTIYGASGDNPLNVELQLINQKWKITNISCTPR